MRCVPLFKKFDPNVSCDGDGTKIQRGRENFNEYAIVFSVAWGLRMKSVTTTETIKL